MTLELYIGTQYLPNWKEEMVPEPLDELTYTWKRSGTIKDLNDVTIIMLAKESKVHGYVNI